MIGYIYFIKRHSAPCVYKIGFSQEPERRIRELQTANAERLELLGVIPGSWGLERTILSTLKLYRANGEWFEGGAPVGGFIAEALAFGVAEALANIEYKLWEREHEPFQGNRRRGCGKYRFRRYKKNGTREIRSWRLDDSGGVGV
jgi:hypothetical protein